MRKVSIFWGIVLLCLVHVIPCAAQPQTWYQGISQSNINLRGSAVIVGQIDINVADPGNVVVQFDGLCLASVGDRIVLAASNDGTWHPNDGNVNIEAPNADVPRGNFSHTRVYPVTAGSHSYYAVAQNYVEQDGDGRASIYGTLTVKYVPTADQAIIGFQGISTGLINLRGTDVVVGQRTIVAPSAGNVLVRFDGVCIPDTGDLIVLAASNDIHWHPNDGNVNVEAVDSDVNRTCFSHSRMYPVTAGSHTYYAVARNYVEQNGSGSAYIYGSLTVEFIPTIANRLSVAQEGISQTNINVRGSVVTLAQIDLNLPLAGKVVVHFDGMCHTDVGDRIVLAASNDAAWHVSDGMTYVEAVNDDVDGQPFSHTRSYNVQPGARSYYAVAQNYVEQGGNGLASIYGSLSVEYFPTINVGVDQNNDIVPTNYALLQNYPNPFNPATTLEFYLPEAGHVNLDIYDILGSRVLSLIDDYQQAGRHRVVWDASGQPTGVYFYRIQAGDYRDTKSMLLVK